MKTSLKFTILLLTICLGLNAPALNVRQLNTQDGLTNSAVLSLCCGADGMLWIGTCDGLNAYDGSTVYQAKSLPLCSLLPGNIIENIVEPTPGTLWVQTNYGLTRLQPRLGTHETFADYQGQEKLRVGTDSALWVLKENCTLTVYRPGAKGQKGSFVNVSQIRLPFGSICELVVFDRMVRLFTASGIYDYPLQRTPGGYRLGKPRRVSTLGIRAAFTDDRDLTLAVDHAGNLLEFRNTDPQPVQLYNISDQIARRGSVSDMITDNSGNIFISFLTDGMIKLSKDYGNTYSLQDLGLNIGVFCLAKSRSQNLVWAGTDCHGVYTFYDGPYTINSLTFNNLDNIISRPVRSVLLDDRANLWLGTKGDGLLLVQGYDPAGGRTAGARRLFTTANSALSDNSVYALAPSRRPLMWIGSDGGLDYYSYADGSIHHMADAATPVRQIHSIRELPDGSLLIATAGSGVYRARLGSAAGAPVLTEVRQYTVDGGNLSSNYFFSQSDDSLGDPLFCNRGLGVFTLRGDRLQPMPKLRHDYGNKTIYDVFAVNRDRKALWLGTGHGLLKVTPDGDRLFVGADDGFLNSTIHALLRDDDGNLWASTNRGLLRFNPNTEEAHAYAQNYGIEVTEFSDGAAYRYGNTLLFGGVDGLVAVNKNPYYRPTDKYLPAISLTSISIAGVNRPLHDYLSGPVGAEQLHLAADENYFTLTFTAPDYINADNYAFMYSLDGHNWIDNGAGRTLTFTQLSYGRNTLRVKYINRDTRTESPAYTLTIDVAAPWYLSVWAKLVYALLLIGAGVLAFRLYQRRQRERQEQLLDKMQQSHREELYEEKLRFFTNITHEFCTPLTLIYGSCERIMATTDADGHTNKYVGLIRSNTERLNTLIQDLIDFRRIETGHKQRLIAPVNVSELCADIYNSFTVIAEQNGVTFDIDVPTGLGFATDYKALSRVLINLLSNAFKYTPQGGRVRLSARIDDAQPSSGTLRVPCSNRDGQLVIEVYNTGAGISEADRQKIFNRYSILDNVEENATRGLSSRNGLGMAICSSLVEMLEGRIEIDSTPGQDALFRIILPTLVSTTEAQPSSGTLRVPCCDNATHDHAQPGSGTLRVPCNDNATHDHAQPKLPTPDARHAERAATGLRSASDGDVGPTLTLLVIDDNLDILTLLTDSLSEYRVLTATDGNEGLECLRSQAVDLIITDVMMPGIDGVSLTKTIKADKHTAHIPLIILSAKNTGAEQVQGLASGADAYVGKPFHLSYLRALIVRLLESRRVLREYYNSSASTFEYADGQLIDREAKQFVDRVIEFIDSNIDDTELSTEQLAFHMQMSVRSLYRRFKELDLASPNDFIKTHRINFAAKLLVTTSLTVQEIIYRTGFNNRSHFYREFDRQFSTTPKEYRTTHR